MRDRVPTGHPASRGPHASYGGSAAAASAPSLAESSGAASCAASDGPTAPVGKESSPTGACGHQVFAAVAAQLCASPESERRRLESVTGSASERYLRLGLQLGRHVEGIVDAYYGPPELAAAVDAEPPVDPQELASAAELLLDELEDGWLRDQVVGLRTYAGGWRASPARTPTRSRGATACGRPIPTKPSSLPRTTASRPAPRPRVPAERYERWPKSIRCLPIGRAHGGGRRREARSHSCKGRAGTRAEL